MPSIDTLISDIENLFLKDDIEITDEQADAFGRDLARLIKYRVSEPRKEPTLRMSMMGEKCDRKTHFDINSKEGEALRPEVHMKFLFGDILEHLLLFLARISGHEVEGQQDRLEIEGVPGHRDAIIDGCLVDVKSASTYSFRKFVDGLTPDNDPFGYITQLSLYLEASQDDPKLKVKDKAYFFVIDKTLGHMCLSPLPIVKKNWKDHVQRKKQVVQLPYLPPRGYNSEPKGKSGNLVLGTNCSYCSHKFSCWPGLRTFLYASGPEFFTKVEEMPKVPELKKDQVIAQT